MIEKLKIFFGLPGINKSGVCIQAGITPQYLNRILRGTQPITDSFLAKIIPVLASYGFESGEEKAPSLSRESITIKKTHKGVWMRRFDAYEKSFTRIGRKEAVECINNARERGDMFSDGDENSTSYEVFGYWN